MARWRHAGLHRLWRPRMVSALAEDGARGRQAGRAVATMGRLSAAGAPQKSLAAAAAAPVRRPSGGPWHPAAAVTFGWRSYVDSVDRVVAVRSMQDPLKILQYMQDRKDSDVRTFEAALRRLSHLSTSENYQKMGDDGRFHAILTALAERLDDCQPHVLSMIADSSARFHTSTPELTDMVQRLAESMVRREGVFDPRQLSCISLALASRGIRDQATIEFIRNESMKLINDFEPDHCNMLLEAFRRWGVFDRLIVDALIERLSDEIDRFTSRDVIQTLATASRMALARGFLLRRLCTLAFENLAQFTSTELVLMAYSLSKLRFLVPSSLDSIVEALASDMPSLSGGSISKLLFSIAMVNARHHAELVRNLAADYGASAQRKSLTTNVDFLWALCALDQVRDSRDEFKAAFETVFAGQPPQNRVPLMKLFDVICTVDHFYKDLALSVPAVWKAACDDADRYEMDRLEPSRLHQEIVTRFDHLRSNSNGVRWQLRMQRNRPCGPVRVDMLDEDTNLVLEIEMLNWPTSRHLKHRLLQDLGYKPLLLNYWEWRRARTEEEQSAFLEREVSETLKRS